MSKENLRKEKVEKEKKEETIPDWINVRNNEFKRTKERANNLANKRFHAKVGNKTITMIPVKTFLQDIVSGKFNSAQEAKKRYGDTVYKDEKVVRKSDNKTNRKDYMVEVYDQVRKMFIVPSPVLDMDYVVTYDRSDDEEIDTTDMPDLETEESAAKRGQGLEILTPSQMLSRLPISLAQLKVGNISQELKNEIRKPLYSLYRSKKVSKTIYKHLMNTTI